MSQILDHGTVPVHDMRHEYVSEVHDISIPANASQATRDRLDREQYVWSHGWIDRGGKHGPPGQQWMVYSRTELPDGRIQRHIAF
jgi:hypothetical protein